jgi:hypothetical protein
MKIVLDVENSKVELFMEFMRSLSFVKSTQQLEPGLITNQAILKSIDDYESGNVQPTPANLDDLKALLNA